MPTLLPIRSEAAFRRIALFLSIGVFCLVRPFEIRMAGQTQQTSGAATLSDAQFSFYSARYAEAAALTLALRAADPEALASYELRSSALMFLIKGALDGVPDGEKEEALRRCAVCAGLMADFSRETASGQRLARARLKTHPADDDARFILAKLDLNYVWLHLGTLGRRTGWNEYWEGRKSLDTVLKRRPDDIRAQVARAWIDYIVDTRMPRGTKWILGGGSRKHALEVVRKAALAEGDRFMRAEAAFALLEMERREKNLPAAVAVARGLTREFPENREVAAFLASSESQAATR